MASSKQKRTKGQKIFITIIGLAFALLLFSSRDVLRETGEVLRDIDTRFLIILPVLHLTSYFLTSKYYQAMLAAFGRKVSSTKMYTMIISLYFVEQALPSGGASGITYIAYALRDVAKTGLVTLVQLGRYVFSYTSYILVVAIGLLFLTQSDPDGDRFRALLIGVPLLVGIITFSVIGLRMMDNPQRLSNFARHLSNVVNRVGRFLRRLNLRSSDKDIISPAKAHEEMEHFHDGFEQLLQRRGAIIKPYIYMAASAGLQVFIVYLSFVAVGQSINPGYVIMAFTLANIVGIISVIPGDVGVHEATMVFALNFMGIDSSIALSATLLYRIYNKMFILGLGFIFYSRFLKPVEKQIKSEG